MRRSREGLGLGEEVPVPVGAGDPLPVGVHEHGVGWNDGQDGQAENGGRVVEGEAVSGSAAAVVADHVEAIEAEGAHERELVVGHGPERIVGVVGQAVGLGGVAVASQVGADHGVVPGQRGGYAAHIALVWGKPCRSSSGGPDPPITQDMSTSPTLRVRAVKLSNMVGVREHGGEVRRLWRQSAGGIGSFAVSAEHARWRDELVAGVTVFLLSC